MNKKTLLVVNTTNYWRFNPKFYDNTYEKYFDNIILYDESNFDEYIISIINNIKEKYGCRGYGYWIWKPYIILQELKKMNDNDILVFFNSHCSFSDNNLLNAIKDIQDSHLHIFSGWVGFSSKNWVTTKLIKIIENFYNTKFSDEQLNSSQHDAGILFIRNDKLSRKIIKEWLDIMINNIEYITDAHNDDDDNIKTFEENRHDQSVLDLILKHYHQDNDVPGYISWGTFNS